MILVSPLYNEKCTCTVLSLAIAAEISFIDAYRIAEKVGRKPNGRIPTKKVVNQFNDEGLGLAVKEQIDTLIPDGCRPTVKNIASRLPDGRYLVRSEGHVRAVINREIFDFEDDWNNDEYELVTDIWKIYPTDDK